MPTAPARTPSTGRGSTCPPGPHWRRRSPLQADLRSKSSRGEKIVVNSKVTFAELAQQWLDAKAARLAPWTRRCYEDSLRLALLPRFGDWRVTAVDADAIAKLIRDLESEGLHSIDPARPKRPLSASAITSYCKPLTGTLSFAVRRGLIASNPYRSLTSDERPRQQHYDPAHEWSDWKWVYHCLRSRRRLRSTRDRGLRRVVRDTQTTYHLLATPDGWRLLSYTNHF